MSQFLFALNVGFSALFFSTHHIGPGCVSAVAAALLLMTEIKKS